MSSSRSRFSTNQLTGEDPTEKNGQEGQGDQKGCARQEEPIPQELLQAQKDSDEDTHDVGRGHSVCVIFIG